MPAQVVIFRRSRKTKDERAAQAKADMRKEQDQWIVCMFEMKKVSLAKVVGLLDSLIDREQIPVEIEQEFIHLTNGLRRYSQSNGEI